jgi:hypothetical protein
MPFRIDVERWIVVGVLMLIERLRVGQICIKGRILGGEIFEVVMFVSPTP